MHQRKKRRGDILDCFTVICSVIYIENRLKIDISYKELEKETGFSIAHIRDVFVHKTGKSLSRYIIERKIINAAFEISHTKETILSIAEKYSFKNPDTFTRAFRRITGLTPSEFRKSKITVGRMKLCAGVYGVGITANEIRKMKGNENNG
jgi:AraC family transcriptional regulator